MTKGQIALSIVVTSGFILLTVLMATYRSEMPEWVRDNFNLIVGRGSSISRRSSTGFSDRARAAPTKARLLCER